MEDDGGRDADGELLIRRARPEDRPAMVELCRASLGWAAGDPNERFFSWKHDTNAFGVSPAWVAEVPGGGLVGVRVFMRWQFRDGPRAVRAVRAVDTATHPDMQGRGIFRLLTLGALPELADEGVEAVFNTPNDRSRPGYIKMGWDEIGRVPVGVRVRSAYSATRMTGARAAARKWSEPTPVGVPAPIFLSDTGAVDALVASSQRRTGLHTDRSAAYLQWRYSFEELDYRVVPLGDTVRDGMVIFRLRRRGTALEAAVCEIVAPSSTPVRSIGRAVGWLLRRTGADYALSSAAGGSLSQGFLPVPRLGPRLTWRRLGLRPAPTLEELSLSLGDVELF